MGEGTDLTGMQELLALDAIDVIASGGIGVLGDIQDLVDLPHPAPTRCSSSSRINTPIRLFGRNRKRTAICEARAWRSTLFTAS